MIRVIEAQLYARDAVRALLLSDIHSNLEALDAVVDDANVRGGFDVVWCLGDTVGYGPDPNECISRLKDYQLVAIAGNHDNAAVGKISYEDFNGAARAAIVWTADQLGEVETEFLSGLPTVVVEEPFTLVHGSLRDPLVEYLLDQGSANATLAMLESRYCLVGHSHYPFLCRENGGLPVFDEFTEDTTFNLEEERWIINPGGVGQPRDRDPRPSYGIFDSETMSIERHRVEYDIA